MFIAPIVAVVNPRPQQMRECCARAAKPLLNAARRARKDSSTLR